MKFKIRVLELLRTIMELNAKYVNVSHVFTRHKIEINLFLQLCRISLLFKLFGDERMANMKHFENFGEKMVNVEKKKTWSIKFSITIFINCLFPRDDRNYVLKLVYHLDNCVYWRTLCKIYVVILDNWCITKKMLSKTLYRIMTCEWVKVSASLVVPPL